MNFEFPFEFLSLSGTCAGVKLDTLGLFDFHILIESGHLSPCCPSDSISVLQGYSSHQDLSSFQEVSSNCIFVSVLKVVTIRVLYHPYPSSQASAEETLTFTNNHSSPEDYSVSFSQSNYEIL